ncbi:MAG: hypothetical protein RLZZ301_955 [Bacteroidota bacterium]|jgi:hypothetical protein
MVASVLDGVGFGVVTVGAMLAATLTTIPAFQMVLFGKHDIAFFRQIIIFFVEIGAF